MASLNTYMTTMSPYKNKFKFADLTTAPMSFIDELYYQPGYESEDLKALLKKDYNSLVGTKDSYYYQELYEIAKNNPGLSETMIGVPAPTDISDFNSKFARFSVAVPYRVGSWKDIVKTSLYENYKDENDPIQKWNLYFFIDQLSDNTNGFDKDIMNKVISEDPEWLNIPGAQEYYEWLFPGLRDKLKIYMKIIKRHSRQLIITKKKF
ncbi:MAG: hypothetical protein MJ146_01550 [Clostridia bacterium]|nr:hypothetical protein [Clostridia bacterium]